MKQPIANQAFASLLRELRLTAGLTQEELAERSRLSVRAISDLEDGRRLRPRLSTVRLLADGLQLTVANRTRLQQAGQQAQPRSPSSANEPVALHSGARGGKVIPANLPLPLTSFVGRKREVTEIKRLLARERFVTLIGTGGCGKTRLAFQVARSLDGKFPDGIGVVALAPLGDSALVPATLLTALAACRRERHS